MTKQYIQQSLVNTMVLSLLFRRAQTDEDEISEDRLFAAFSGKIGRTRIAIAVEALSSDKLIRDVNMFGGENEYVITGTGYKRAEEFYLSDFPNSVTKLIVDNGLDAVFDGRIIKAMSTEEAVPASDRFVERNDNQDKADDVGKGLQELEAQIKETNEGGAVFGDDRDAVADEVGALRAFLAQVRIRASVAIEFAKKSLGWISEKAGSAAIGDLAKRVLASILDWLT